MWWMYNGLQNDNMMSTVAFSLWYEIYELAVLSLYSFIPTELLPILHLPIKMHNNTLTYHQRSMMIFTLAWFYLDMN